MAWTEKCKINLDDPGGRNCYWQDLRANYHSRLNRNFEAASVMICVNSAFNTLRDLIPTEPQNRKLSKIEILRLARSYIKHLDAVVSTGNIRQPCMTIYDPNSSPVPTPCSESTRPLICTFCIASKYN